MATKVKKKVPHKQRGATLSTVVNKYIADELKREKFVAFNEGKQLALDLTIIALGRMGFRATRILEFDKNYAEVWDDYSELLVEVSKEDPDLWEAKAKIDREIKLYVGDELFVPYEKRHSYGG